jgi:rhodanese-related sulfurtransferase
VTTPSSDPSDAAHPSAAAPGRPARLTIDDVLARARAGLHRLEPAEAAARLDTQGAPSTPQGRDGSSGPGSVLVDIRPQAQRQREGEVPGALVVERNVLEWRFDPASEAALPLADHDLEVIVLCSEGYTSSLAAAALQELGVHRATDVVGGFQAWAAAGLPTVGVPTPDASTADASTADASTADASTADASTADASTADASTADASTA